MANTAANQRRSDTYALVSDVGLVDYDCHGRVSNDYIRLGFAFGGLGARAEQVI